MIVADTHAWLWWASSPDLLSRNARAALDTADVIVISALSCYEAYSLLMRGRVDAGKPPESWLHDALRASRISVASVDVAIAAGAAALPREVLRDPIDRIIVATALLHDVPLVTADRKIREPNLVPTIW